MLNYEEFKKEIEEKLLDYMPGVFKDFKVSMETRYKTNKSMEGVVITPSNDKQREVFKLSPVVYLEPIYKDYVEKSLAIDFVIEEIAMSMKRAFNNSPVEYKSIDPSTAKDNVVIQLVNTQQNQELLANTPHRSFNDLSIIYRWVVDKGRKDLSTSIVRNENIETLGFTSEEELYQAAIVNTSRLFPVCILPIQKIIRDMMISEGFPEKMVDTMLMSLSDVPMYMISNDVKIHGASSILYVDELQKLADSLDSDLYLLPSSIHEVIAMPSSEGKPEELSSMVHEINFSHVNVSERLSNQVYQYSRATKTITMVSDSDSKIVW